MSATVYPAINTQDGPLPNLSDVLKNLKSTMSGLDISDSSDQTSFGCKMSTMFGNFSGAADILPEKSLIAVVGVVKTFAKSNTEPYDSILASFMDNPVLQCIFENKDLHSEMLTKTGGHSAMTKGGKTSDNLKKDVVDWFKSLIKDDEVINMMNIDTAVFADILATAPNCVDKATVPAGGKHVFYEKQIFDIGVLRMPDAVHSDFLLLSLQISISTDCFRPSDIGFSEKSSLSGIYKWKKFQARESMIDSLTEATKIKAIQGGKNFYSV